jgi:hypothetical protein
MANLRDGYFGRSQYILQRLKRAVGLAAAEDRRVVRPEPEQVLVSVVALDENALHLSLTLHGNLPAVRPIHQEFVAGRLADFNPRHYQVELRAEEPREHGRRRAWSTKRIRPLIAGVGRVGRALSLD